MRGKLVILVLVGVLLVGACSSDDGGDDQSSATTAGESTTTTAVEDTYTRDIVETLADDSLEGRDNQSPGSEAAQEYLTGLLQDIAEPLPNAPDGFAWDFPVGTNLIGLIPGGDKADEYVVLGAHYDHLGTDCPTNDPADTICNGAGDDAAGVAAALTTARALATADEPPERSVIIALWDAEEDGLLGSVAFVDDPPIPLDSIVTYLNWDIQGTNLTPALATTTVMVGAETGGPNLLDAANTAAEASGLRTLALSLLFGQGRSDHATFAAAGVPTVFFTDSNNSCYHTAQDDLTVLDFDKLQKQTLTGIALAQDLVATDTLPEFDPNAPAASFQDAESMLAVVDSAQPDFGLFPESRATVEQYLADLNEMVDAGEAAFDDDAVGTLLGGAVDVVDALTHGECDGYLDQ